MSCIENCQINRCSLDITFNETMRDDKNLKEMEVARFLPVIGFVLELLIEIAGIFIVYYIIHLFAPLIVGNGYNNNFLYSMLLIPIITSLKKFPEIFKSVFVRISISDEYIICKRGYFRKFIDKLYIEHIDNIELRTTIWGEWFNYGGIYLYSFGGKINLPFLKNPCVVYEFLKKKMTKRKTFGYSAENNDSKYVE